MSATEQTEATKQWLAYIAALKDYLSKLEQGILSNVPTPTDPTDPTTPTKPTEGTIKPGGWGANPDPNTWKVTKMINPNTQFKVVDSANTNVATNFTTEKIAQQFIDYMKTIPVPPPVNPDPTNPPATGMGAFGVKSIKGNGKIHTEYKLNNREDGKRRDFTSIGTKGVEITGYFALDKAIDDEVSGKTSTLSHSGDNRTDCYDMGVSTKGGRSRIRFEQIHPNYTSNLGEGHTPAPALGNKFIGYKFLKYVNADGTVTCQVLVDTGDNEGDKPANEWKEIFKWTDTKYKIGVVQKFATIRIDDPAKNGLTQLREKWIHAQEIN